LETGRINGEGSLQEGLNGHGPSCRYITRTHTDVSGSGVGVGKVVTVVTVVTRGLHSSTSQLNLSRVCHKETP